MFDNIYVEPPNTRTTTMERYMSAEVKELPFEIPEQAMLEQFESLNETEKQKVVEQVLKMQSVTAEASLRSTEGYDILKELYRTNVELLLLTSHFIIPTSKSLVDICSHLTDPDGFKRSYATLIGDIEKYRQDLQQLWSCHSGKTGAPTDDDISDVFTLADGYNTLLNRFETGITPLMDSLKATLNKEYIPVLEKENVDA